MVYITGDTHAQFNRFNTKMFPEQKEMSKDDYVIICGDFGGVWNYSYSTKEEKYWLDWLGNKPFTLLFVDGKKMSWNNPATARYRSKTPVGVAKAMAEQWG